MQVVLLGGTRGVRIDETNHLPTLLAICILDLVVPHCVPVGPLDRHSEVLAARCVERAVLLHEVVHGNLLGLRPARLEEHLAVLSPLQAQEDFGSFHIGWWEVLADFALSVACFVLVLSRNRLGLLYLKWSCIFVFRQCN